MPKRKNEEFLESRTSWKWFERKIQNLNGSNHFASMVEELNFKIQLEILKELQHLNNK